MQGWGCQGYSGLVKLTLFVLDFGAILKCSWRGMWRSCTRPTRAPSLHWALPMEILSMLAAAAASVWLSSFRSVLVPWDRVRYFSLNRNKYVPLPLSYLSSLMQNFEHKFKKHYAKHYYLKMILFFLYFVWFVHQFNQELLKYKEHLNHKSHNLI